MAISQIFRGGSIEEPAVVAAIGAATRSGQRVAVVLLIPSTRFAELMAAQNLPSDWIAALLDADDQVVTRSRDASRFIGTRAIPAVREALAAMASGIVRTRTVENLPATLAIARAPTSRFSAVIAVPESVFGRFALATLGPVALIGAVLVLAAVTTAMIASRSILTAVRDTYAEEKSLRAEVTESLRVRDAELEASERRFQTIADAMPQLVWSTLPDGYHDYFNDRWYQFTGTQPGSTMGGIWNVLLHPDDQARSAARWEESLRTGQPYEIEYRFKAGDGSYRWFMGRAVPVRDGGQHHPLVRHLHRHS